MNGFLPFVPDYQEISGKPNSDSNSSPGLVLDLISPNFSDARGRHQKKAGYVAIFSVGLKSSKVKKKNLSKV